MADAREDGRDPHDLERAAAETREPERAMQIRREDDARTEDRQEELSARQERIAEDLERSASTLERTADDLARREAELQRTAADAQRVAEDAAMLRRQTEEIHRGRDATQQS